MCSRSAALVTLRVSATAMNALTRLRSMGRIISIRYSSAAKDVLDSECCAKRAYRARRFTRGTRVLTERSRRLDKPHMCGHDLHTFIPSPPLLGDCSPPLSTHGLLPYTHDCFGSNLSLRRPTIREVLMRGIVRALAAFMLFVLAPGVVYAQATLAGVARDTSGAVLPGVTVEATSPVLIEKVRTATTDDTGRFSIPDLRPGTYKVTFSLTGFRTVVRDGLELTGTAVITVNADMAVGGVQETITVSGDTPVVDLQSTTRQAVMDQEVVSAIPSSRTPFTVGVLIPGVRKGAITGRDVG